MVGWVGYVWERPETAAELAKNPPSPADQFFDRLDVNGDERITLDEIPERLKPFIQLLGVKFPEKGMTRQGVRRDVREDAQGVPAPPAP